MGEEDHVVECKKFQESIDELNTKLLDMREEKLEQERIFDDKIQLLEEEKQSANKDYCATLSASTDKITACEAALRSQKEDFVSINNEVKDLKERNKTLKEQLLSSQNETKTQKDLRELN